jgi:small subunit ribosomal protein S8e
LYLYLHEKYFFQYLLDQHPYKKTTMGISRDHWHKRRKTGGKRPQPHKKRKFELGRPAAQTKLGSKRIHTVRTRGGNKKYRALRLDIGNFSWGSEGISKKTRVIDVMYHPSNMVRQFFLSC